MKIRDLLFIFILNNFHTIVTGDNILVVMPICFSSHLRPFIPLVEELIKHGHNVTVISTYPMANVHQAKHNHVEIKTDFCQSKDTSDVVQYQIRISRFARLAVYFEFFFNYAERILNQPELQRIIHSEDHYDLVMAEFFYMDVFFALGYKFKAPIVALCPTNLMYVYSWTLGNPYPSSYIPNQFLWYTEDMSLHTRFSNLVFNVFSILLYELVQLPKTQKQMEKFFNFDKNNIPQIKDIMKNISLVLVNSHYSFGYIQPELLNIVNIGGIHYPSFQPLSQKMKTFMEEANDGIIYVSLGSLVQPRDFKELGILFTQELKRFPQRVIMKWDRNLLYEVPENFIVEKWIPQTQVLNHPKCRLFITHGGLHSAFESINASVPFVGIPILSDQYYNMAAAEYFDIGRTVPLDEVSVKLSAVVKEVLSNPRYKENIIKRSQLFRDRLVKPLDEAMYWMEQVMKHKNTSHLKPAAVQLTWYEFYGVDVLIILLTLILSTLLAMKLSIVWITRIIYSRIRKTQPSVTSKPNQKVYKFD